MEGGGARGGGARGGGAGRPNKKARTSETAGAKTRNLSAENEVLWLKQVCIAHPVPFPEYYCGSFIYKFPCPEVCFAWLVVVVSCLGSVCGECTRADVVRSFAPILA
jgi:hypothetical protein